MSVTKTAINTLLGKIYKIESNTDTLYNNLHLETYTNNEIHNIYNTDEYTDIKEDNYLTFTFNHKAKIAIINSIGLKINKIEYKLNRDNDWHTYEKEISFAKGYIKFRGNYSEGLSKGTDNYIYFSIQGNANVSGNVLSLINYGGKSKGIPNNYCFYKLFSGCPIIDASALNLSNVLTEGCYDSMFWKCDSLTAMPILNSKLLANSCYRMMFLECTSLTRVPNLPASDLKDYCYYEMFKGCTSLSYVNCNAYNISAPNATTYWLKDVAKKGYFVRNTACTTWQLNSPSGIPDGWTLKKSVLTFICVEDGNIALFKHNFEKDTNLEISRDGVTYNKWYGEDINLKAGDKLYIIGYNEEGLNTQDSYITINNTGTFALIGDVMSLLSSDEFMTEIPNDYCFYRLFYGNNGIISVPELSAMELKDYCYAEMFCNCEKILDSIAYAVLEDNIDVIQRNPRSIVSDSTETHICLNATELADGCYYKMFYNCKNIKNAPKLNALTLKDKCYNYMFSNCEQLKTIQCLAENPNVLYNYKWMNNVNNLDTFIKNEETTTWSSGINGIPKNTLHIIDYSINYLTFTCLEAGGISLTNYDNNAPNIEYKLNNNEWQVWDYSNINLNINDKVLFRGNNIEGFSFSPSEYNQFVMSGKISASGNIMSLIDKTGSTLIIPCEYCFYNIFQDCISLTQAPELPATQLANYCYDNMFYNCTSLTQAPELPAIQLANYCYSNMFYNCTSLTQAPELPATQLASCCYWYMFGNCTSLTQVPELPATQLAQVCYAFMFSYCTSLTQVPELPATQLVNNCYAGMFVNCSKLSYVKCLATTNIEGNTSSWLSDVSSSGTFVKTIDATWQIGSSGIPSGWTIQINENYLTFTCLEAGGISLTNYDNNAPNIEYKLNDDEWQVWDYSNINLNTNDKVLFRGNNIEGFSFTESKYSQFVMSGKISASGSIMSLIDKTGSSLIIPCEYCFYHMFYNSTSLTQAPELPATQLAERCYASMFSNCLSLTQVPELLATQLVERCYASMFYNCTSLTHAPELPAIQLANYCYDNMFYNCTSLTQAPELPATQLAENCYLYMFNNCTSLIQAPELPATQLAENCYWYMFNKCTSLTHAPELPATQLANNCYSYMFVRCSKLSYVKCLATTNIEGNTSSWLSGVSSTGTFIKSADATWQAGSSGIPSRWTIENDGNYLTFTCLEAGGISLTNYDNNAPNIEYKLNNNEWLTWDYSNINLNINDKVLFRGNNIDGFSFTESKYSQFVMSGKISASGNIMSLIDKTGSTLIIPCEYCFYNMFRNCASLTHAPELPATQLTINCYDGMFSYCTSLIQAPELPATQLANYCYFCTFEHCTSLTQAPELPATQLAEGCYEYIFYNCTSLTQAPELPATQLTKSCYEYMFYNCTSLTQAPELPATQLTDYCYTCMFSDCSKLSYVKCLATTNIEGNTSIWLSGVSSSGTFIKSADATWQYGSSGIPSRWTIENNENYLTFTCLEAGGISLSNYGNNTPNIEYKLNDGGWTTWDYSNINLNTNDKVLFRGNNIDGFSSPSKYSQFVMSGKISASGSIMSLIDKTGSTLIIPCEYCFYNMFRECTSLTQAPELPATQLAKYCYIYMFYNCTSLTQAPDLSATQLTYYCYAGMFYHCTSLTQVSELPATQLAEHCYASMFGSCTNLSYVKCLATTNIEGNTSSWLSGVSSSGTFIKSTDATWQAGSSGIPSGWTIENI